MSQRAELSSKNDLHALTALNDVVLDSTTTYENAVITTLEESQAAEAADAVLMLELNKNKRLPFFDSVISNLLRRNDSFTSQLQHQASAIHPIQQLALQQFQEAMSLLPLELKIDYLTAQAAAPTLVLKESDPIRFLRSVKYNPWAGAENLAAYWKLRREVLQEKAFLPLTLTGNGALDDASVAITKTGNRMFLPKDSNGRIVVYGDASRFLHEDASIQSRAAVVFYFLHLVTEDEQAANQGIVVILDESATGFRDKFTGYFTQIIGKFSLLNMHAVHVCSCRPKWQPQPSAVNIFEQGKLKLVGIRAISRMNMVHYHYTEDRQEMMNQLKQYGLREGGIPVALGGTWQFENHVKWYMERIRLDGNLRTPYTSNNEELQPLDDSLFQKTLHDDSLALVSMVMNKIPARDKVEYEIALCEATLLVQKESNINDFLCAENYHVANACRRRIAYWRIRRRLFGVRFLNVVSQTGEGVLGRHERDLLAQMNVVLLPSDDQGRSVIWIDTSAWVNINRCDSADRILFYILSLAAENSLSQNAGIIILVLFKDSLLRFDKFREIVLALPLWVRSVHLLCSNRCPTDLVDQMNLGFKPYVHIESSLINFGMKLAPFGLARSGLPVCLGGTWDIGKFLYWQELRIRREWGLPIRSPSDVVEYPGLYPRIISEAPNGKEKARRMEVVRARRKSDRIRVETALLEDQVNLLRNEQEQLTNESRRLGKLLTEAMTHCSNSN